MVFPGFNALRRQIANFVDPNNRFINSFNDAFLWGVGGGYTAYDTSNITYIEKGYNVNPIVYAVVNQMAKKTAAVPFYVREVKDKKAYKRLQQLQRATKGNYSMLQLFKRYQLEQKAYEKEDKPFPMDRPNVYQTWSEFMALYKTFLACTGNVYIYTLAPEDGPLAGQPSQVYLLPSQYIQIIVKPNADMLGIESPIAGYQLTYGRTGTKFLASEVIHIKYSNPNYGENGEHLYGQSPLRAALKNIQSSNSALDLNIKTLKSGGAFGLIHGKNTAITEKQAKELKNRLLEMDKSPEQLSKLAGISTEIGFTRLSLTSDELKPFDYLKFDQKQICNVLSWSDKLLNNDEGAKYDNVNQYRKQVVTDNIQPDLKMYEEAINTHWLKRFKGYENCVIEFDVMELPEMQEDLQKLTEWLTQMLDRGVINRAEAREGIRYPETGNADMEVFTVNNDVMTLEEAIDTSFTIGQ